MQWTDDLRLAAWQHMGRALAAAGVIDGVPDLAHKHPDVLAMYGKFTAQGGAPIVEHESPQAFTKAFDAWLDEVAVHVQPVGNTFECRVSMTRHYGPLSVEFSLAHTFAALPGQAAHHAAVRYLNAAVKGMASEWERENLTGAVSAGRETANNNQPTVQAEKITGVLEHNVEAGKHRWRIKGGRFTKFGVPVYSEALTAAGLTDKDPVGAIGEFDAVIEFGGDGKPKRAVALVALTQSVEF